MSSYLTDACTVFVSFLSQCIHFIVTFLCTMSSENQDTDVDPIAATINVKLPHFCCSNPRLWFGQVEAIFRTNRIRSQSLMYSYVVQSIPTEVAEEVCDLIHEIPAHDPYNCIKQAIISRVGISEQKQLDALFSGFELGDRKPSQLLRHMQQLLGTRKVDDGIFRYLWMKHLPPSVRVTLATFNASVPLSELAEAADKILEAHATQTAAPISSTTVSTVPETDLGQQVAHLTSQMATVLAHLKHSRSPSSRPLTRKRSRTPRGRADFCWYHRRYGAAARRCQKPCTFNAKNSGNAQASQ